MKNIIYTLLTACIVTSCADMPEEYGEQEQYMNMNITDAESVFIVSNSSINRTSSRSDNTANKVNKLFKLTEDGAVEEVILTLEDNSTLTEIREPLSIDSIEGYVIFTFGPDVILPQTCYLVNISTGKINDLGGVKRKCPVPQGFSKQAKIFTDEQNNLYFRYGDVDNPNKTNVQRVNLEDMSKSMYSPDTADVMNFMVDSFGNMVYTDWEEAEVILRKKDGELYTLLNGENDATASTYWIGLDGNIYIFDVNNDTVYRVTIDSNGDVRKTLYETSTAIMVNADTEILKLNNNVVFVTYGDYSNITVDDGYTFKSMDIPFESITNVRVSDKYVYLSGDKGLIKIDLFYDTITQIYNEEIHDFDVTSNDSITFSYKNVLGKINENGDLTITHHVDDKVTNLKLIK